jgi:hypothetical protein
MNTIGPMLPARHKNVVCCELAATSVLDSARAEVVANRLKALSDPTRLQLLDLLVQQSEPLCVCDLLPTPTDDQPSPENSPRGGFRRVGEARDLGPLLGHASRATCPRSLDGSAQGGL